MNAIHWNTMKTTNTDATNSYGDRFTRQVEITTTLQGSELLARFAAAVNKRFPFNATHCSNQHSAFSVSPLPSGRVLATWETYHSIGD